MPQTQVVVCGDRESDIYELYDQIQAAPKNVHLLMRGQHDRCLSDATRLRESLSGVPVGGTLRVEVPRREGRPARSATLELHWKELELQPPAVALKKSWPPLKVYAVLAREVGTPEAVQPLEWLLLSTWPVKTLKMARRLVRWYALRWGIECWHKVLKVVCGVERRQMTGARAGDGHPGAQIQQIGQTRTDVQRGVFRVRMSRLPPNSKNSRGLRQFWPIRQTASLRYGGGRRRSAIDVV